MNSARLRFDHRSLNSPFLQLIHSRDAAAMLGFTPYRLQREHHFHLPTVRRLHSQEGQVDSTQDEHRHLSDDQHRSTLLHDALRELCKRLNGSVALSAEETKIFKWCEAQKTISARSIQLIPDEMTHKLRCTWDYVDEHLVIACLPILQSL